MKYFKSLIKFVWYIPRNILILIIWIYQKTLSPDHGPLRVLFPGGYCKFIPTCSDYAKGTLKKHGVIIGVPKSFWRILRCNPWSCGGHDPF